MVLIEGRRKDLVMSKIAKKSTAKTVVKSAELVVKDRELAYEDIWAFV